MSVDFVDIYYKFYDISIIRYKVIKYSVIDSNNIIIDYFEENELDKYLANNKHCNKMLTIDKSLYLQDILKCYNYSIDKIIDQLTKDFPRSLVYINKTLMTSLDQYMNILKKYKSINTEYNIDLYHLLLLLCNQSSYYATYNYFHKKYSDIANDILVTSSNSKREIEYDTNALKVSIKTDLEIKNINNNKIVSIIHTVLYITMNEANVKLLWIKKDNN